MWCYCQYKVSSINPFCCNIIKANTEGGLKNMKWKLITIMFTAVLLLFGCQSVSDKNASEGEGTSNKTIEKTRYNEDGKLDRNNRNITRKTRDNTNITDKVRTEERHSNNRSSNNRQDEYDVSKESADRIVDEIAEI